MRKVYKEACKAVEQWMAANWEEFSDVFDPYRGRLTDDELDQLQEHMARWMSQRRQKVADEILRGILGLGRADFAKLQKKKGDA